MFRPRVIPVLLLKDNGLVKTKGFDKKSARYLGDPINVVRLFNDFEADELVFLDITATIEKRTISVELVKSISDEAFMPFAVGGGITTVDNIASLLSSGAEKVVINTACFHCKNLIRTAAALFGDQSIIASVDVKRNIFGKYVAYSHDGSKKIDMNLSDYVKYLQNEGAGEILINSIDRDGTMVGYDLELLKLVANQVTIPVIACGGAGNLQHFKEAINTTGVSAVSAGSLFVFHGPRHAVLINYPEKKELNQLFYNYENQ